MSAPQRPRRDETWHRYGAEMVPPEDLDKRVHVWRARLDIAGGGVLDCLTPDELERAARFHAGSDRNRFTSARSILRLILAPLIGEAIPARAPRFEYGLAGKPFLVDDPKLAFNISHSDDVLLVAVTRTGAVGIDIERQRPVKDMANIARIAFDDQEKAALMGCPPESRDAMFYRIWTRKEALIKASGAGFSGLSDPNVMAMAHAASEWCLSNVPHLDGYTATLARPRAAHGITLWSWPNAFDMRGAERRVRLRSAPAAQRHILPSAYEARP